MSIGSSQIVQCLICVKNVLHNLLARKFVCAFVVSLLECFVGSLLLCFVLVDLCQKSYDVKLCDNECENIALC